MGFLNQIREALAKKHAAQHPESKQQEQDKSKPKQGAPVGSNKPQKKVTGRGR